MLYDQLKIDLYFFKIRNTERERGGGGKEFMFGIESEKKSNRKQVSLRESKKERDGEWEKEQALMFNKRSKIYTVHINI